MEPCPRLSAPPLGGAAGPEALAGPGMARAEEGPGGSVALCPSPGSQGRGCLLQLHRPHRLQPNPWRAPHLMGVTIGPGQTGGRPPITIPTSPGPHRELLGRGGDSGHTEGRAPTGCPLLVHLLCPQPSAAAQQGPGRCMWAPGEKGGSRKGGKARRGSKGSSSPARDDTPARRGQLRLAPDR